MSETLKDLQLFSKRMTAIKSQKIQNSNRYKNPLNPFDFFLQENKFLFWKRDIMTPCSEDALRRPLRVDQNKEVFKKATLCIAA